MVKLTITMILQQQYYSDTMQDTITCTFFVGKITTISIEILWNDNVSFFILENDTLSPHILENETPPP